VVPMPRVASRQEGTWTLALSVGGKPVFKDVKDVSVLPTSRPLAPSSGGTGQRTGKALAVSSPAPQNWGGGATGRRFNLCAVAPATKKVAVYDPSGAVGAFLTGQGMAFVPVKSLNALPAGGKVLIVGPDALDVATSTSSKLAAYASSGRTVIVLEQKNPLKYQGLPFAMDAATNLGAVAFSENLTSPIFRGLEQKDLLAWGPDSYVYRNAYAKPTSGGKSLVECDWRLQNTALAEMPAGKGDLILSQLLIGSKLASNAVAQQILLNMIGYGETFGQSHRAVSVAASDNPQLIKALDASSLQYGKAADPLQAIAKPGGIAIVNATPANLHALASNLAKVAAFTQGGGWIIFNNLTPDGLADYNKIVGVQHLIRPYGKEKVSFPAARDPLTAGLATSNIVMGSGQQIFNWSAGQYPDTDAYSYVVDYDDVAPFGKSPFFAYGNIVNNFTNADGWPLIINFPAPADGKPYDIPITLPRPEKIEEFKWIGDTNYYPETKVNLLFDGGNMASFDTLPNGDLQTFPVTPPRAAQTVTLQMAAWDAKPGSAANLGIDNIYLKAYRSPEFYKKVRPMLNIGAMMDYPKGKGGIVLCNVKYKDAESVPENADKKRLILSTILRNLDAPFAGGKSIIAGANLEYHPVDISKQANQYRTERGWFGDKAFTFADLPTGKHVFGGVSYNVYDFATSPVPTAIMLGGNGIPNNLPDHVDGIPVGRKADALFFLQAARIDQRRNRDELRDNRKFEMADYVVHYADGQTVKVPIYSEISVYNYQQETPTALPGAQIAWTKPYADGKSSAVAYSMQWNNPRPAVAIQTIDLVYGPDRRGVPALLAVTAANARQ
ncbi:MAG: hypothetical protein M3Y13_01665, partial [Armatimonadota bacterium]|nr:hypothetical protein [Armatimonadota bacterium]